MKPIHILSNISKQDIQRWYDLTFCIGFATLITFETGIDMIWVSYIIVAFSFRKFFFSNKY